ncbi:hypothetical protein Ancab_007749 [Ancistrocladus abbreviatus]
MARQLFLTHAEGHADVFAASSGGFFLLICIILTCLSVISIVIFACGDGGNTSNPHKKQRHGRGRGEVTYIYGHAPVDVSDTSGGHHHHGGGCGGGHHHHGGGCGGGGGGGCGGGGGGGS